MQFLLFSGILNILLIGNRAVSKYDLFNSNGVYKRNWNLFLSFCSVLYLEYHPNVIYAHNVGEREIREKEITLEKVQWKMKVEGHIIIPIHSERGYHLLSVDKCQ